MDEPKTLDLLAAGYVVVRLREYDLTPLALEHPRLLQRRVLAAASRGDEAMDEIADWLADAAMPVI